MRCIEPCSARKTYLELLNDERSHGACFHMGGGLVVGKREGGLEVPGMHDHAKEVGPAQET